MTRSAGVEGTRRTAQGVPLVGYPREAGLPAISARRWPHDGILPAVRGPHAHEFLVLLYVEGG
ncbi:MAG: AraC family transcriptional regulator, partial [Pseudonocardia sp.]